MSGPAGDSVLGVKRPLPADGEAQPAAMKPQSAAPDGARKGQHSKKRLKALRRITEAEFATKRSVADLSMMTRNRDASPPS